MLTTGRHSSFSMSALLFRPRVVSVCSLLFLPCLCLLCQCCPDRLDSAVLTTMSRSCPSKSSHCWPSPPLNSTHRMQCLPLSTHLVIATTSPPNSLTAMPSNLSTSPPLFMPNHLFLLLILILDFL
ncbi:uncharacterized protein DS421_9g258160 [Arachis hypogaea]|nr:uncharacterized protein DS421_9g258160 [Arachis hypogaea]